MANPTHATQVNMENNSRSMLSELENKRKKSDWMENISPSESLVSDCQAMPSQPCPLKVLDAKKLRMAQHGIEVPGRHGTRSWMNGSMGSRVTE